MYYLQKVIGCFVDTHYNGVISFESCEVCSALPYSFGVYYCLDSGSASAEGRGLDSNLGDVPLRTGIGGIEVLSHLSTPSPKQYAHTAVHTTPLPRFNSTQQQQENIKDVTEK